MSENAGTPAADFTSGTTSENTGGGTFNNRPGHISEQEFAKLNDPKFSAAQSQQYTALAAATFYLQIKQGKLPQGILVTGKKRVWPKSVLDQWWAERIAHTESQDAA